MYSTSEPQSPVRRDGKIRSITMLQRYCKQMMQSKDPALVLAFAEHQLALQEQLDHLRREDALTDRPEAAAAAGAGR